MRFSSATRMGLRGAMAVGLSVIYLPLLVVLINSVNKDRSFGWPPSGITGRWWSLAVSNAGARAAVATSVTAASVATAIALVLGTMTAFAVGRYQFFGRETVSFLVILPIALPGIVTGIALNAAFSAVLKPLGVGLGLATVVVGHATFCVVVVYNNVLARLRRVSLSVEEASADLGARPWQTFWFVLLPAIRSALVAGGLLAFALSFDEIIVTTFTAGAGVKTLPIWIFENLFRPNQAPVVNVVAVVLVVMSVIPIYLAQLVSSESGSARR
jgi:putative spermidine/putrescine transport system permease protein